MTWDYQSEIVTTLKGVRWAARHPPPLHTHTDRSVVSSQVCTPYSLSTHYSLLTTHYSLLTTYYLQRTTYYILHTTYCSLLTTQVGGFIPGLYNTLESQLCIDTTREYAAGESNGGIMTYQLGVPHWTPHTARHTQLTPRHTTKRRTHHPPTPPRPHATRSLLRTHYSVPSTH